MALVAAGVLAGFLIGVVASIMGVTGGELIIPTVVLLFGTDIKVAGSLSLAVSLPTAGLTGWRCRRRHLRSGSDRRLLVEV